LTEVLKLQAIDYKVIICHFTHKRDYSRFNQNFAWIL